MNINDLIAAIEDPSTDWEADFDRWAVAVFAHQFQHNVPYRGFCEGRGVGPHNVKGYRDVPPVPTDVFKHVELTTHEEAPERVFKTSGTTQGLRGSHIFKTLAAYRAAVPLPFQTFVMPKTKRMPIAALAPAPSHAPESSLSFWIDELLQAFGDPTSGFYLTPGEHGLDFDFDGVERWLNTVNEPVLLIGTAFAYVELFDTLKGNWTLPAGSRVLETGGLKGKTREVSREELYGMFADRLGIAPTHCVSEYSMTELSSQAYTQTLRDQIPWDQAYFETPPWARVELVDPMTMQILDDDGARGLICWYDLANFDSVLSVQTSDIGIRHGRGFELIGRASDAELRGCSLTIEEIVDGRSE